MESEIRIVPSLSEQEDKYLFEWKPDVFDPDTYGLRWRQENDAHLLLYEDGRLVSHVSVLKHIVCVGNKPVTVGGIGALVTLPDAQGKGYAHALLERATQYISNELGVEFGLLFCPPRLVPFYERLGWQLVKETVMIDQPRGKLPCPFPVMVLSCQDSSWPQGAVDLQGLPW